MDLENHNVRLAPYSVAKLLFGLQFVTFQDPVIFIFNNFNGLETHHFDNTNRIGPKTIFSGVLQQNTPESGRHRVMP